MGSHRVICHPAEEASPPLAPAVVMTSCCYSWYSIYPPIKDERLSRPEQIQVNNLSTVAEVPAIPDVSWLSRPSAHKAQ